jgi:hypothetical protein
MSAKKQAAPKMKPFKGYVVVFPSGEPVGFEPTVWISVHSARGYRAGSPSLRIARVEIREVMP